MDLGWVDLDCACMKKDLVIVAEFQWAQRYKFQNKHLFLSFIGFVCSLLRQDFHKKVHVHQVMCGDTLSLHKKCNKCPMAPVYLSYKPEYM